jgi:hypothetical protein
MPLHDWAELPGWEGVHLLWMTELLRDIKAKLPAGFRAYIGSGPALAVGAPTGRGRPDVAVRTDSQAGAAAATGASRTAGPESAEPDVEVAVATLDPDPAILVERDGRLVAAVELVSPRNKDRRVSRDTYLSRYLGYLLEGANLLLVDVHPRPSAFSFADRMGEELRLQGQPSLPAPFAVSYRVGEPAASGGRLLAVWRRSLRSGEPLPPLPLPLTTSLSVPVDLEHTYRRAAADAYLS